MAGEWQMKRTRRSSGCWDAGTAGSAGCAVGVYMQPMMHDDAVRKPRRWELLRAGFSNWPLPAVLAFIDYRSSRVWPGRLTAVGDMRCDLHARSGTRLVARVRDVNAPAEVFGRNEYDGAGIDWS